MARNSISLSIDPNPASVPKSYKGPWKLRWREDVIVDGVPMRQARGKTVSDIASRDALATKLRRTLEVGDVFVPEARTVTTSANLEAAGVAWLKWHRSNGRADGTITVYKSALARIFATIRKVQNLTDDDVIRADVLSINLFSDLRNQWSKEDTSKAGPKCSPWRRYDLSLHLYTLWTWAASQPLDFPAVPVVPLDAGLVLPPAPARTGAPEAPTWAECDSVIRRAYVTDTIHGDLLAGERLTGLRVDQVASIRREDIDTFRNTLIVATGKSEQEKAEKRKVPVPAQLLAIWTKRIAAATSPDSFLFPAATISGHVEPDTDKINGWWKAAEEAGEVRPGIVKPRNRRKGRPNHAFRAAYMAGLESVTVEIDGQPVRRIVDSTIDFMVGHAPTTTRGKSYTPPTWAALAAAVHQIDPVALATAEGQGSNVVAFPTA